MSGDPRHQEEYSPRQTAAARRVLVDLGQVLAGFEDCIVIVGGWVPDLLLPHAEERHVGSIDVDVALDAEKLGDGRYAELFEALIKSRRYYQASEPLKLYASVDLEDGEPPILVDVDFLKSAETKIRKNKPKLTAKFRPLDADGCAAAFNQPNSIVISGKMISGAQNKVRFRVASIADFLVMKCYALMKRDKPKDAYDICYCIDYYPGGVAELSGIWGNRKGERHVATAIEILREKFSSVEAYGPMQVVEFFNAQDRDERARQARRAFELVKKFLEFL